MVGSSGLASALSRASSILFYGVGSGTSRGKEERKRRGKWKVIFIKQREGGKVIIQSREGPGEKNTRGHITGVTGI